MTSASAWAGDRVRRTTAAWRASCGSSAEEKLKAGELRVMVATASLELGIDIGAVDLVVQLGQPAGDRA